MTNFHMISGISRNTIFLYIILPRRIDDVDLIEYTIWIKTKKIWVMSISIDQSLTRTLGKEGCIYMYIINFSKFLLLYSETFGSRDH